MKPISTSLLLRNLLFTVLQPGIVVALVPYYLARYHLAFQADVRHISGIVISTVGLITMLDCILTFAWLGEGTLSPADPTRKLVVRRLYRFSRNPMYVGVMLILTGESIYTASRTLWIYSAGVFVLINLFIVFFEEPRLRRDFGEHYLSYCKNVRRWI